MGDEVQMDENDSESFESVNETSRVENDSNTCPKCGKIYPTRSIRFLPSHISKCKAEKRTSLNMSGLTTSLEDALANSASSLDSNSQPDADLPNASTDEVNVDKSQVRETTSLKSKFDSVNKDDGEFEQHLSNLIEDLNAHEHSIVTTNEPKIKDWSNVCGICGKKFKFAARMKTHQRVKCGVEGSVPLEDA